MVGLRRAGSGSVCVALGHPGAAFSRACMRKEGGMHRPKMRAVPPHPTLHPLQVGFVNNVRQYLWVPVAQDSYK